MAEQKQEDQLEHTYSSYVKIRDSPEDLPEAMNDREKWRKKVRDICAGGTTWWWWLMLNWIVWNFYQNDFIQY